MLSTEDSSMPSTVDGTEKRLTLIYSAHFEDVPCQSGVNDIFEG